MSVYSYKGTGAMRVGDTEDTDHARGAMLADSYIDESMLPSHRLH
jgi:hypothetical protein